VVELLSSKLKTLSSNPNTIHKKIQTQTASLKNSTQYLRKKPFSFLKKIFQKIEEKDLHPNSSCKHYFNHQTRKRHYKNKKLQISLMNIDINNS
jgi:hypothetical protein